MHKNVFILENKTQEFLRDFEIQIDCLIPARRRDLVIINKLINEENLPSSGFCRSGGSQNEKKKQKKTTINKKQKTKKRKKHKYLELDIEPRKWWNIRVTVILIVINELGTMLKGLKRGVCN